MSWVQMAMLDEVLHASRPGCGFVRSLGSSRCPEVSVRLNLPMGHLAPCRQGGEDTWTSSPHFPLGTVPVNLFQMWLRLWGCSTLLLTTDLAGDTACRLSSKTNFFCAVDCRNYGPNAHCMGHRDLLHNVKELLELPRLIHLLSQPQNTPLNFSTQLNPYLSLHCLQKL